MYSARIIADSISPDQVRLVTMQVTFPRFILAEFNTHRQFSRNSASSRAIPVAKRIAEVRENPFVPEVFTANKRGMQGGDPLEADAADEARQLWLNGATLAAARAEDLAALGVHKQYANRLLEPFLWHTAVVTATEWSNFFAQRCHPDAQPEIRRIAEMMRDLMATSVPEEVNAHFGIHLPYITYEDRNDVKCRGLETRRNWDSPLVKISVARCARVSYAAHDENGNPKERDIDNDLALYDRLRASGHWSPFEHVAIPGHYGACSGNFRGWIQFRKTFHDECR